MHVGEKIKAIRLIRAMTLPQVAEAAAMNKGNLSRIERDGRGFSPTSLGKIALALGTTASELMSPEMPQLPPPRVQPIQRSAVVREQFEEDDFDPGTEVRLPVFDIEVSGGPGVQNPEFIETRETLTFRKSWLRKIRATPEDLRIVTVRGSSMEPTLWDGDKLAIHTGRVKIRDGRVFAIAYNGDARVKRLYLQADGRLRISSDNRDKEKYPDESIEGEEMNRVHVIGQAVHRMGEGGL